MTSWLMWIAMLLAPPPGLDGRLGCGLDGQEPNNTRRRAARLEVEGVDGAACQGDEDWFQVRLERGERLVVRLQHHPTARFDALEVFPPRGRRRVGKRTRARGGQVVEYVARGAGVHRLRVRSPEGVRAAYRLELGAAGSKPALRYPPMAPGKPSTRR